MKRRLLIIGVGSLLLGGAIITNALVGFRGRASHGVSASFLGYTNAPSGRQAFFELKNTGQDDCWLPFVQFRLRPADGSRPVETKSPPQAIYPVLPPGGSLILRTQDFKQHGKLSCTFYVGHEREVPEWRYKLVKFLERVGIYRRASETIDHILFENMWPVQSPEIDVSRGCPTSVLKATAGVCMISNTNAKGPPRLITVVGRREPGGGTMKRIAILSAIGVTLVAVALWVAAALEFEFPFWPTLWLAAKAKTPTGTRVTELVRTRSGNAYMSQHWHHCTWCDVVYPHAPHSAVKVTVNTNEYDFYLFDWDVSHRRLLPASLRTAKLFPELIPTGYTAQPLGVGLNPQLYRDDEPCSIVAQSAKK